MKSNIVTLIATIAIPLTARAAPEPNPDKTSNEQKNPNGIEIPGKSTEIPDKENLPEKIVTKFYQLTITDVGEAAAKLKEHSHGKNFQAVPDHRTSRMILMGSEGDIKRAIEMLNKMEREQDGTGQPATRPESKPEGSDKP